MVGNKKMGDRFFRAITFCKDRDIQNCLLKFAKAERKLAKNKVTFEISDNRITCVDGPCKDDSTYDVVEDPAGFVKSVLKMAKTIENPGG